MAYQPPTVEEVAVRLGADPSDVRLPSLLDAALETQATVCNVGVYTASLHEAAIRRCAFLWASMPHTLGVLDTGDTYGVQYLPLYHPDWDALEMPHRIDKIVVA